MKFVKLPNPYTIWFCLITRAYHSCSTRSMEITVPMHSSRTPWYICKIQSCYALLNSRSLENRIKIRFRTWSLVTIMNTFELEKDEKTQHHQKIFNLLLIMLQFHTKTWSFFWADAWDDSAAMDNGWSSVVLWLETTPSWPALQGQ